MSVSAAPWFAAPSLLERCSTDAGLMAARCGDDVVRLTPVWTSLIAATRFARRTDWTFGNAVATLTCTEPQQRRWLTQRDADDPVQVQFDFGRWSSAYARVDGGAREIDVFAADGSSVAAVRLDDIDPTLDELLWQLAADDQRPGVLPDRQIHDHTCSLRAPYALVAGALQSTLSAACDAGLPLCISVSNAGGSVTWSPRTPHMHRAGRNTELRSALGSVALRTGIGAECRVGLSDTHRGEPKLEAVDAGDAPCFSIALSDASALQRLAWRGLCSNLVD